MSKIIDDDQKLFEPSKKKKPKLEIKLFDF